MGLTLMVVGAVGHRALKARLPTVRRWYAVHRCLAYLAPANAPCAGQPACWRGFAVNRSDAVWTTAFLHSRTTKGGLTRLVAVDYWIDTYRDAGAPDGESRPAEDLFVSPYNLVPESLWSSRYRWPESEGFDSRSLVPVATGTHPKIPLGYGNRAIIYNGQPDPLDPSHFTICYELDGKRRTIDGWLLDSNSPSEYGFIAPTVLRLQLRDETASPSR